MTPAQRREARSALAMLPIGVLLFVVSALALVAVLARAVRWAAAEQTGWDWPAWCLCAAVIALCNMRAGIAMMSAFDWRPLPLALALSGAALWTLPEAGGRAWF